MFELLQENYAAKLKLDSMSQPVESDQFVKSNLEAIEAKFLATKKKSERQMSRDCGRGEMGRQSCSAADSCRRSSHYEI
ncbi:Zinc finger and BTB domain-containing protein [Dirofilaria immitis]